MGGIGAGDMGEGTARTQYVTVGVGLTAFVPRAARRRAIVFSPPSAGTLSLYWDLSPGANPGIVITSGQGPVVMSKVLHGALVTGPVAAIASGGPLICTYAEEGAV